MQPAPFNPGDLAAVVRRPPSRRRALALAATLACVGAVHAQNTIADRPEATLPAVKVKAQTAKSGEVVEAASLANTQAKDAREALQAVPGVSVGGGGNAIAQKIYVRGLEDTLLGVTLDGAPQGGYLYHHQGRVLVDPALLKSVQVQKGVASASAGPGALAGALSFETQDAGDLLAAGQSLGGRLGLAGFSNKGWKAAASAYGQSTDKAFDGLVSVARQDIDEYRDGNGQRVIHSGSTQDSALAKLSWQPLPGHRMSLGLNHFNDEGVRFLRPNMVDFARSGAPMPQTYRHDQVTLGYRSAAGGDAPAIEATLFGDDNRNERTVTATGRNYGEEVQGRGINASMARRFGEHRLKLGLNYHAYDARALNPANVGTGPYGNGRETSSVTGMFVEDGVALAPRWQLAAGLRVDSYRYHDDHGQRFSSTGASPSLGLQYLATEALTLHASAGSTMRGAGLKESFLLDNGPGYRNVADLKAERSRNLALGFDAAMGVVVLRGEVFQQKIGRYITTGLDADDNAIRHNAGELVSRGYELGLAAKLGGLQASASVAHAKPRLNGVPLADGDFGAGVATGRTGNLKLTQAVPALGLDLGWTTRVIESLQYAPASDPTQRLTKAGYSVHDVFAVWRPQGVKGLQVKLAVNNLLDKFYYDQATYAFHTGFGKVLGYPEPGRDVRVELGWQF